MADAPSVFILQLQLESRKEIQGVFSTRDAAFSAALTDEEEYARQNDDTPVFSPKSWHRTNSGSWENTSGSTEAWIVTKHEVK